MLMMVIKMVNDHRLCLLSTPHDGDDDENDDPDEVAALRDIA